MNLLHFEQGTKKRLLYDLSQMTNSSTLSWRAKSRLQRKLLFSLLSKALEWVHRSWICTWCSRGEICLCCFEKVRYSSEFVRIFALVRNYVFSCEFLCDSRKHRVNQFWVMYVMFSFFKYIALISSIYSRYTWLRFLFTKPWFRCQENK